MKRLLALALALVLSLFAGASIAETTLVTNGGFEEVSGDGFPSDWNYEAWYTERELGYASVETLGEGNAAFIFCGAGGNDARLCQTVKVKPNSYYKLTCRVKTENVAGGAGANISVNGSLATSEGVFGTSEGWVNLELTGKTAKGQKELTVCVRIGGYGALSSGSAWFDDVNVEKLTGFRGDAADFSVASTQEEEDENANNTDIPGMGYMVLALLVTALASVIVYRRFIETDNIKDFTHKGFGDGAWLAILLVSALLIRCALSLIFYGHSTDINCFMAWAYNLAENGIGDFYTSGMFADYPPGYMYVLFVIGKLGSGLTYGSAGYALLTKMPGILSDLLAAYLVYRIARRVNEHSETFEPRSGKLPLVLAGFVAFNPLMAFISGGWGQIDQLLTLLLLAVFWLFLEDRPILAGLVYGVAILTKPQALMVGPLLAAAYIMDIRQKGFVRGFLRTAAAVLAALAAIFLLSLPFGSGQEPFWFLSKILGTATSYPYASIEAFNLMALLGGNWAGIDTVFLGLTYGAWGTIFIVLSVVFAIVLYVFGRDHEKHALTLSAAWLIAALFTLGQYMHERYLFPALLLLLVAFVYYRDRRLITAFLWMTASALFNAMMAFVIVDNQQARGIIYDIVTAVGALMNIGAFAYLTWACCGIVFKRVKRPAFAEKKLEKEKLTGLPDPVDTKLKYTKRDRLYVLALTLVYGVVALINLGTTVAPESYWTGSYGDTVTLTLAGETHIKDIRVYGGLYTGTVELTGDDGTTLTYVEDNGDMFRWASVGGNMTTAQVTLKVTVGEVWFNEIALFDDEGNYIEATASAGGEALLDERDQVPAQGSYLNGMYFDELYHARTAYEHLNGLKPYENSHPPLGKILIMAGIAVFGMNTLGWRIVGALFGVAMVPILYAFGKRLFKNSEYALLVSVLFAFDFMHYTQTRIATIDVYGVFFIILMFYYMVQYFGMNFYSDGIRKTLKPLALGGLFFGLGAASKWICIYAGGGMAVLLFVSLLKRYAEYLRFKDSEDETLREAVKPFARYTIVTLLWCVVFYIALPVAIYLLSYLPYVLSVSHYDLEGIWGVQKFMYNYHSTLTATHPYQSPWWQWPLILRPMWYYVNYDVAEGSIGTISAMGNPAVWWVCCVGSAMALIKLIRGKLKPDHIWVALFVALLAELVPWVLVTRCTFIYHYFASVPFIILIAAYLLQKKEERDPAWAKAKWIWMGAAVLLFILFYPVITGTVVSRSYVSLLEWLPSWTFMGY
ncbi:MAG TPA: phospholipid carrier-dependent glycosyltransferase [Clostridia bacterium]|nr:phospholipid carrier-dependent glycosyltransferase [Clostridia bacterium]